MNNRMHTLVGLLAAAFLAIMSVSCKPEPAIVPGADRFAVLYTLPVDFADNGLVFGALADLEQRLGQNKALSLYHSNTAGRPALLVVFTSEDAAAAKELLQNLVDAPVTNLAVKTSAYGMSELDNNRILDRAGRIALVGYPKKESFRRKSLASRLRILRQENRSFEEFSIENQMGAIETDTLIPLDAASRFSYMRFIGYEPHIQYSVLRFNGLELRTNREGRRPVVLFEGNRVNPPDLAQKIR